MNKAYLSLGSNRGTRRDNLEKAKELLSEWAGDVLMASSIYETPPWHMTDRTNFYNQVLLLSTPLPAIELIDTIIVIETMMGRRRTANKYEPRIIDIDILFFNEDIIQTEELIVPHSLIQERKFVLQPLAEIAPALIHPALKKDIAQLLEECPDKSETKKLILK